MVGNLIRQKGGKFNNVDLGFIKVKMNFDLFKDDRNTLPMFNYGQSNEIFIIN